MHVDRHNTPYADRDNFTSDGRSLLPRNRVTVSVLLLAHTPPYMVHVLLVEPDAVFGSLLYQAVSGLADVRYVSQFAAARSIVQLSPVHLLVTNLRLGAFNGLHLVYLAALMTTKSRAIVYTDQLEIGLGREIQRAGAFYDTRLRLPHTLASYVRAALPSQDRRHLAVNDRRQAFRGGRRSADRPQSDGLTAN